MSRVRDLIPLSQKLFQNMVTTDDRIGAIRDALGKPAYCNEGYMLYVGDCLSLMRQIPRSVFDLTITSPPYNIGKEYEDIVELPKYIRWCKEWMAEIYTHTLANGAFWLNVGYVEIPGKAKAAPLPYLLWDQTQFLMLQEVVWNYGAGVATRNSFSPRNEKFLWYIKNPDEYIFNLDAVRDPNVKYPNQKKNGKLKCNPLGKNPTDVWQFPKVTSGQNRSSKERTPHPAQFPVAVIDRIIKACSNQDDIVFDPFCGSGTTIEAALRNGRHAIGFEIREDYAKIAAQRIERWLNRSRCDSLQKSLF